MPDSLEKAQESHQTQQRVEGEKEKKTDDLSTCVPGGLSEEDLKSLKEELDRAKEESSNNFSSSSGCVIV